MALSTEAVALIARHRPQIFDIWGNPFAAVALNPQPLPPEPPGGFSTGVAVVRTLALAEVVGRLGGTSMAIDVDDWCPTPRPFPWPLGGPVPGGGPFPEPWVADYNLGVAAALELAGESWARPETHEQLTRLHDVAVAAAGERLG